MRVTNVPVPVVSEAKGDDTVNGEGEVRVEYQGQKYSFPGKSVRMLPVGNISLEAIAEWIWKQLEPEVRGKGIEKMAVAVEELEGLCCWYENEVIAV